MRAFASCDSMSNMQIRVSAVIVFLVLVSQVSFCQGRHTARSMVVTKYGIVATSHTLASQAGAEILRRGGSAVDAAIAANATLGVIEPMMNGIGGDLFAIYWDAKTGKLYGINSSGWAPQGLTVAHLKAKDMTKMPLFGIDSVTVPGAVAGWNALYGKFGHMPWKDIFQPAIFYADQGFDKTVLADLQVQELSPSFALAHVNWHLKHKDGSDLVRVHSTYVFRMSEAKPAIIAILGHDEDTQWKKRNG